MRDCNPQRATTEKGGFWHNLLEPALLLTLLVPGLGHLYTGRGRRALFWFLLVEGLFLAGWWILGVRFFGGGNSFGATPFGLGIPLLAIPEIGNFLATWLVHQTFPAVQDPTWVEAVNEAKMPVPFEEVGFFLTGAAGLVNLFAAADAWWFARRGEVAKSSTLAPALAALLSWLVPGLGQWRLGHRTQALFQFGAITGLFVLGLAFSGFTALDRAQVYFWYAGMIFNGGATALGTVLFAGVPLTTTGSIFWDLGVTVTCIAGLMNVVVIIDAYTLAEKRAEEGGC